MTENLLQKLQKYGTLDYYPLHMPGHKRNIAHFGNPFSIDITEIDGFDNLFHADGILKEAQQRAAELYGAEETFYLVNGSTCGLLSAISASVRRGGRILMARNSHKASYHAVFLNGLHVTYLYPEADMVRGIHGSIRPDQVEAALWQNRDTQAVLITSPTYDGVVSDIETIARLVHQAGAILIVDEAHGAHFPMHTDFPKPALAQGADLVINSIHKTLPSMTQTALLHVQGDRVDRCRLKKYLGIYQSSSPSYVLMAGMDACICLLAERKEEMFDCFIKRLDCLRASLGRMKHLHLVTGNEKELYAYDFDRSKILISTEYTGWNGPKLSDVLRRNYHLEMEMEAEHYVTAIMTAADTQEGFERLERALLEIDDRIETEKAETASSEQVTEKNGAVSAEQAAEKSGAVSSEQVTEKSGAVSAEQAAEKNGVVSVEQMENVCAERTSKSGPGCGSSLLYPRNEEVMCIEDAENSAHKRMLLSESGGQICGEYVYLYPPGIPLIVPGERILETLPELLAHYRFIGLHVQGMEDYTAQWIRVVDTQENGTGRKGTG